MADKDNNDATLKEFLILKIDDLKDLMDQRQSSNEQAFHSAIETVNRRHDLERRNLEEKINKNLDRINEIDKKLFAVSELKVDKREGLSSKAQFSAILFAVLSFIGMVISLLWNIMRGH